jgi:hypothetical protein
MKQPLSEHRDTPLWKAVDATIAELVATGEISIATAPDYVTAHICRMLASKRLITDAALNDPRDRDTG